MTREECESKIRKICQDAIQETLKEYGHIVSPEIIGQILFIGFDIGLGCVKYTVYDD